jgi:Tol biopolymer transport system component
LLNFLQSKFVDIVAVEAGEDRVCPTEGLLKQAPVFSPDGQTIYFLGAREDDPLRNDVYAMPATCGQPKAITSEPGYKQSFQVVPKSTSIVYLPVRTNPFARPAAQPGDTAPASGRGGAGGRGAVGAGGTETGGTTQAAGGGAGGGGRGGQGATSFALVDTKTGVTTTTNGTGLAISADGSTWAYLVRAGEETTLMAGPVGGEAKPIKKTRDRLANPAVAPDGSRVAVQMMPKDDWEIYVWNRDGSNETRVTREIQHDTLPRFVTNNVMLAATGEGRHLRSSLYDLTSGARVRLFHNNTIRTIAPEYAWIVSSDGRQILVSAERDGDTVSPERGIYLVPLDRKVTTADVVARLDANLTAEKTLRAEGQRMYAPIAAAVRQTLADVSINRIDTYEKKLFEFDSKHISKPGNRLAGEYLFNLYRSFGYEPEYQWFEPRGALDGKSANIIATLKGTENPELIYVVSSHYDSNAVSPGGDDDSSATAALVEAARVLAKRPMPATIVFASFTGEEAGLLGSREFVRRAKAAGWKIVGALNNDMIGWSNDHRLDNTIRYSNPGIRDVQHGASLFTRLITYDSLYFKSTDAAAYYEAYGDIVGGIGSYPVLGNPHYHQPTDLLETVNHDLVTETSRTTIASIMLLASSPSRLMGLKVASYQGKSARLTWTPSPEKGVHSYVVAYGPAQAPFKNRVTVLKPEAVLSAIEPGTVVSVKAVNAKGLEGWEWARVTVK